MSAFTARKSILFVVLVALFGVFMGLSSSNTVKATDECDLYDDCGPCEMFGDCYSCEMYGDCYDPCEMGIFCFDPCYMFDHCFDPCFFGGFCFDPCEMVDECEDDVIEEEDDVIEEEDDVIEEEDDVIEDVAPVVVLPTTPELCLTGGTQVTLEGGMMLIFSDFRDTPNGMIISQIPLRSLRAPSDEEKASGAPVLLGYKDSEFAPGWSVAIYWQNEHYGVVVYTDGGQTVYEDTGAICGWS